nr:MAG TPA: hypothetical protein [Caudoviricetes sp.]
MQLSFLFRNIFQLRIIIVHLRYLLIIFKKPVLRLANRAFQYLKQILELLYKKQIVPLEALLDIRCA